MTNSKILDSTNLRFAWPALAVALAWTYLGCLAASLEDVSLPLVAGALAGAGLVYQLTTRTPVDLGYVSVGAAGASLSALGLWLAPEPQPFLLLTLGCGALSCLPFAILGQVRVAPQVPGWLANALSGLACFSLVAAIVAARDALGDLPLASLAPLGAALFAALSALAGYHLLGHVILLVGRAFVRVVYRVRFEGVEQVPAAGAFLACSNHVSYIDWLLMGVALPRPFRIVGDHAYVGGWFQGFFRRGGGITIASARENPQLLAEALEHISAALERGHGVGLHPEGYMTRTGYLQPIRPGVELILARSPVPVVPVFIDGMYGSFLSRKFRFSLATAEWTFRRRVLVRFGAPIPPEGFSKELLEEQLVEIGATRESDLGLESRSQHVQPQMATELPQAELPEPEREDPR